MKKWTVLLSLLFALPTLAAEQRIVDNYKRACVICHASGVAGAPRTGATGDWQTLIDSKGVDALVQSVRNGLNAMPPKGMCFDCSDEDYAALIEYMMNPQE